MMGIPQGVIRRESVLFYVIVLAQYNQHGNTVKPVYNDHLMGYISAFWSSSMSSRRQKLLARVNWYIQSSLKHITE